MRPWQPVWERLTGSSLGCGDIVTPGRFERLSGSLDSSVDVLLGGVREGEEGFASGRVDSVERLLVRGLDPFVVTMLSARVPSAVPFQDRERVQLT